MRPSNAEHFRTIALTVLTISAGASAAFTLHAGRNNASWVLKLVMVSWVLTPFILLVAAWLRARRWPTVTRTKLYLLMLAVSLLTVSIYSVDAVTPHAKAAAVFVIVPPASWLLMAVVTALARFRATGR